MATIHDVARRAGVSSKTVSRVLNSDAPVNVETRRRVEAAMDAMGYVPSSAARAMRSRRSGLVGLITGAITLNPETRDLRGLPDLPIVQGIQATLSEADATLLIADTGGREDRVPKLMRTFAEHRVEGIIYVADHHTEVALPLQAGRQLVLVNCFDRAGTPCVLPDDRGGQRQLTESLIAAGHRRIAYIGLPENLVATGLRVQGYRDALQAAGISFDPALVSTADLDQPDGQSAFGAAIEGVLATTPRPTVIACGNDRMAMAAYGLLRSRGLAVPRDISVAGYDDYQLISESLFPALTTAELPYRRMGERAAEMLMRMVRAKTEETEESGPQLISGSVKWRDSVRTLTPQADDIQTQGRKTG